MGKSSSFSGKLDVIQIVRAFSILSIILFHIGYGHYYFSFLHLEAPVQLFYLISAFLFMYTTQTVDHTQWHTGKYISNKLIRILPLYWILTVLTFISSKIFNISLEGNITAAQLFKSLFFIPYYRGSQKEGLIVSPIIGPAWYLFLEVYFILISALSLKLSKKYRGVIAGAIVLTIYIVSSIVPSEAPIVVVLRSVNWLCFVGGILSFYIIRLVWDKNTEPYKNELIIVSILLFALNELEVVNDFVRIFVYCVFLCTTIVAIKKNSCNRMLTHIGDISYSVYLLHYYIIIVVGKFFDLSIFNIATVFATLTIIIFSLISADISAYFIEKKVGYYLKRRIIGQ